MNHFKPGLAVRNDFSHFGSQIGKNFEKPYRGNQRHLGITYGGFLLIPMDHLHDIGTAKKLQNGSPTWCCLYHRTSVKMLDVETVMIRRVDFHNKNLI